jgi:importin subunit alpha-1
MILKCEAMDPLIKIIETSNNRNTIKHGTWALSNLCRGRPLPNFERVKKAIPTLAKVIREESGN